MVFWVPGVNCRSATFAGAAEARPMMVEAARARLRMETMTCAALELFNIYFGVECVCRGWNEMRWRLNITNTYKGNKGIMVI